MNASSKFGVLQPQSRDRGREFGGLREVPVAAGDAQVVLEPGELASGADGLAADGVPVGGGAFNHGGELTAARIAKTVRPRLIELDSAGIYLCLASASTLAAFEGSRLAMLVAAAWAFDVLFAAARRNVRRGRRA